MKIVSNSSIQSVRVSVSSSPYQNEMIKTSDGPTATCSSSTIVEENQVDREKENFDRRPLLDLINQLNQNNNIEQNRKTLSPSPTKILPAKQISPFRPVILRKKYQVLSIYFHGFFFSKPIDYLGTHRSI